MADVVLGAGYDHPNFLVRQQQIMKSQQGPSTSLTDFAVFRCRNKCIVTHATVTCISMPSAGVTTWSLYVMRDGSSTIATKTLTSFSTITGLSAQVITVPSSGTLASIGNYMCLHMDSLEKGKYDVIYEYVLAF